MPIWDGMLAGEISATTVLYSLAYQYFSNWKSYIIACTLISGFLSFVGESLLITLSLYELHRWNLYFSFLVYLVVAVLIKLLVNKLKTVHLKANK